MQRSTVRAAILAAGVITATTLTACSGGGGGGATADDDYVSGGTFVWAITGDPGALNPMQAVDPRTWEAVAPAYEALVEVDPDGKLVPWLAKSWDSTSTEVTFTLKDGITCSDGSDFTADTVVANIDYSLDPDNATFYYGSQLTDGMEASADGDTVTVTSPTPNPFLVENVGTILMVCDSGLADLASLDDTTAGTGLFALTDVDPGASYTYTKRDDYTWGPGDVTSDTVGLPDELELRVIADESTAANLLLAGDVNSAVVLGADRARLDGAKLSFTGTTFPVGMMLFNEKSDRVFADPLVREALSTALDRDEIGPVIAGGESQPSISLVTQSPRLCVKDKPDWTLPDTSLDRAAELLDQAGWLLEDDGLRYKDGKPLTVKFIYNAPSPTHAPSAELVKQTWDKLGVTTNLSANDASDWSEQLYQTFDWDTGWIFVTPGSPSVLSLFFAGATPDKGGLNFMWVDNPEYSALQAQASQSEPDDACAIYQKAEAELIDRFDVFPLADNILPTYMSGATFEQSTYILPTTIRMKG